MTWSNTAEAMGLFAAVLEGLSRRIPLRAQPCHSDGMWSGNVEMDGEGKTRWMWTEYLTWIVCVGWIGSIGREYIKFKRYQQIVACGVISRFPSRYTPTQVPWKWSSPPVRMPSTSIYWSKCTHIPQMIYSENCGSSRLTCKICNDLLQ